MRTGCHAAALSAISGRESRPRSFPSARGPPRGRAAPGVAAGRGAPGAGTAPGARRAPSPFRTAARRPLSRPHSALATAAPARHGCHGTRRAEPAPGSSTVPRPGAAPRGRATWGRRRPCPAPGTHGPVEFQQACAQACSQADGTDLREGRRYKEEINSNPSSDKASYLQPPTLK